MPFIWKKMVAADFARYQRLMESKILDVGGNYWSEVRPFFYRPSWPLQEFPPDSIAVPRAAFFGGAQFAVPSSAPSNCCLNLLVLDQTRDYALERLARKPRKQVRLAAREFVIRPITDVDEFKQQGFPIYQSFHARTRYRVGAQRKDFAYFSHWADQLFQIPGVLILGGYREGILGGVSLTFLMGDTLDYASFFCDNAALELHLSDLMLHAIRESVAVSPGIERIFLGTFKGNRGLDNFKLLRGATLLHQRAWLEVNPVARLLLRTCGPKQYAQLVGRLDNEQTLPDEVV